MAAISTSRTRTHPQTLLVSGSVGVVAGFLATGLDWRLALTTAGVLPLTLWIVLAERRSSPMLATRGPSPRGLWLFHTERWLAWTWLGLMILPGIRLFTQDAQQYTGAGAGGVTLDNVLMLGASAAALLAVGAALQRGWPAAPNPLALAYLAFTGFALLSFLWSVAPAYTFARALQYVALAAFTALTCARCLGDPRLFQRLQDYITPRYVLVVALLGAWGLFEVGLGDGRFHWPGTHPNAVAAYLATAVLLVAVNPRRARVLAPVPWILPVLAFSALLVQTEARGYTATAVGAAVTAAAIAGARNARLLGVAVGAGLVVGSAAFLFYWTEIIEFIMRDQTMDQFLGLTGRVEAWRWIANNPIGSELWGVGLGANQGLVVSDGNMLYNAHNAWFDLLQSLGVLGIVLLAAVVMSTMFLAVLRRSPFGALFSTYVLAASITSATISMPTVNPALLGLAIAAVTVAGVERRQREAAEAERPYERVRAPVPRRTLQTKVGLPSR